MVVVGGAVVKGATVAAVVVGAAVVVVAVTLLLYHFGPNTAAMAMNIMATTPPDIYAINFSLLIFAICCKLGWHIFLMVPIGS